MSGQLISLPQLLSHCNKNLDEWLKGLKQQTSYSLVQLNQIHLLLHGHSQDMGANQPRRSHPPCPSWLPPFYTSCLLLLVVPCAEQGLHPPPVKKGSANGHMLKADWQLQVIWQQALLCISSHNPVCYNQMYICVEYVWTINGLLAA